MKRYLWYNSRKEKYIEGLYAKNGIPFSFCV